MINLDLVEMSLGQSKRCDTIEYLIINISENVKC